jgi:hypothetical protein
MSLGYAEKLSYHEDLGGQLGAPELFDADADVRRKVAELAALVRVQRVQREAAWLGCAAPRTMSGCVSRLQAGLAPQVLACDNIVVFIGAGISTSCGIPDFRQARALVCPMPARANARASAGQCTHSCMHALLRPRSPRGSQRRSQKHNTGADWCVE